MESTEGITQPEQVFYSQSCLFRDWLGPRRCPPSLPPRSLRASVCETSGTEPLALVLAEYTRVASRSHRPPSPLPLFISFRLIPSLPYFLVLIYFPPPHSLPPFHCKPASFPPSLPPSLQPSLPPSLMPTLL